MSERRSQLKVGDLVRYKKDPGVPVPQIIPSGSHPIGMVMGFKAVTTSSDTLTAAIMEIVFIRWSNQKWNTSGAFSEEHESDLIVVQRIK